MARVAVCPFHWGGGAPRTTSLRPVPDSDERTFDADDSDAIPIPPRPCTRFAKHCPDVVAVVIVRILVVPPRCAHPANCRPATPPPPSRSELCSRRHHTMHSSSEASSTAMMSKRSKEGGWSSIGEIRRDGCVCVSTHLVLAPSFFQGSLL